MHPPCPKKEKKVQRHIPSSAKPLELLWLDALPRFQLGAELPSDLRHLPRRERLWSTSRWQLGTGKGGASLGLGQKENPGPQVDGSIFPLTNRVFGVPFSPPCYRRTLLESTAAAHCPRSGRTARILGFLFLTHSLWVFLAEKNTKITNLGRSVSLSFVLGGL